MQASFAWLCGVALYVATRLASASTSTPPGPALELDWHAPRGCPDAAQVLEKLAELLGPERSIEVDRERTIVGRIEPDVRLGWVLSLHVSDGEATHVRRLDARRCEDLALAAAVALALLLGPEPEPGGDPERKSGGDEAAPSAEAPSSTQNVPDASRDTAATPPVIARAARSSPSITPTFGVEALLDFGSLGPTAFGFGASAGLELERFRFVVSGLYLPPRQTSLRSNGQQAEFRLATASAGACYRPGKHLPADVCAGLELGRLSADGVGLRDSRALHDVWFAPRLGFGLGLPLISKLLVTLHADAVAPLVREQYVVNRTEDVHRVPPLLLRLGAGVTLALE